MRDNPPIRFHRKLSWNGFSEVTQLTNSRTGLSSRLLDLSHVHITPFSSHESRSQLDSDWCGRGWNVRVRCLSQSWREYMVNTTWIYWYMWQVLLTSPFLPTGPRGYVSLSIYRARNVHCLPWTWTAGFSYYKSLQLPECGQTSHSLSWRVWWIFRRREQEWEMSAKAVKRWKRITPRE